MDLNQRKQDISNILSSISSLMEEDCNRFNELETRISILENKNYRLSNELSNSLNNLISILKD